MADEKTEKKPLTRREREALIKELRRVNARLIVGTRTKKEDEARLEELKALLS